MSIAGYDADVATTGSRHEMDTPSRILDVAERIVQTRGFNGFSYADIAGELGVTKASLHYHFPSKAELGSALIARYAERFADALDAIDAAGLSARESLTAYAALYLRVLQGDRMCLCGILAAEYQTLQQPMRDAVTCFFDANQRWLAAVLERGRTDGTIAFEGSARDAAGLILSGLEGAMLVARAYGDSTRFESAAERLLASVATR
jgi:TetR/AcrR family transcriptional regulator, transcriptional repressor for nem operon